MTTAPVTDQTDEDPTSHGVRITLTIGQPSSICLGRGVFTSQLTTAQIRSLARDLLRVADLADASDQGAATEETS